MPLKNYNDNRPPRKANGQWHRRFTFGDAKQGDSSLARFDPDAHEMVDWRECARDNFPETIPMPPHENRVWGCTRIKSRV